MAPPFSLWAEALIGGAWVDLTGDVRASSGLDIKRGISSAGGAVADRGTCSIVLNDNTYKYSSRNVNSPYYGQLGRNTQVRCGVVYGAPRLNVTFNGTERASTPDAAVLDITGDLDVRADLELNFWGSGTGTDVVHLVRKYVTTGNQRSWSFDVTFDGYLRLVSSANGTAQIIHQSTLPLPLSPGERASVRATLDVDNGASGHAVRFYYSRTAGLSGPWIRLGDVVTVSGTTSVFNSTAPVEVGVPSGLAGNTSARFFAAQVRNGIDGTVVANPDFTAQTSGATSFADTAPSPRTWTVTAGALNARHTRFHGEVPGSAWEPSWGTGGQDVTVPLTIVGRLQRMGKPSAPVISALQRSTLGRQYQGLSLPAAYWPMEDGPGATVAASAVDGALPLRAASGPLPQWGQADGPPGSASLPDFSSGGQLTGPVPVPALPANTHWSVEACMRFPTEFPSGFVAALGWETTSNFMAIWEVDAALKADGGLQVQFADRGFDNPMGPYQTGVAVNDGEWHWITVDVTVSGGTGIAIMVGVDSNYFFFSQSGIDWGFVKSVTVNPTGILDARVPSLGHVTVWGTEGSPQFGPSTMLGNPGDAATARVAYVAANRNLPVSSDGYDVDTEPMGAQYPDTDLQLLTDAALTDEGLLTETRDALGVRVVARGLLENAYPVLELPYFADPQPLLAPLVPTSDDPFLINDSTVTRTGGSSGRVQVLDGPLSVDEPEDGGIGRYAEGVSRSLWHDDQAAQHAGWRTALGTVDVPRFTSVPLAVHKNPAMIPEFVRVDTGSRIRITAPLPAWLPPEALDQIVTGYSEYLDQYTWTATLYTTPYDPYRIMVWEADTGTYYGNGSHWDTDGSVLASSVTSGATALSVTTTTGVVWGSNPADLPFDLEIGGERVRVTAVGRSVTGAVFPRTSVTGWTGNNATVTLGNEDPDTFPPDGGCLLITPNGSSASGGANSDHSAAGTVTPGAMYTACLWAKSSSAVTVGPAVDWYDASDNFLSSSVPSGTALGDGQWTFFSAVVTAPASASRAVARARHSGTPAASATWLAWGVQVIDQTGAGTSPQPMTVERSRNGVVKSHSAGDAVQLADNSALSF